MLNLFKMDIYRMFREKMIYITWILLLLLLFGMTVLIRIQFGTNVTDINEKQENAQMEVTATINEASGNGSQIDVDDIVFTVVQSKLLVVFIGAFAILFSLADIKNGYIKNIGGQVRKRSQLLLSKGICILIYTILTFIWTIIGQSIWNLVLLGNSTIYDWGTFLSFLLAECLLHIAVGLVCMTLAMIMRGIVVPLVFVFCLGTNVMTFVYTMLNKAFAKLLGGFCPLDYLPSLQISTLPFQMSSSDVVRAIVVTVIFGIGAFDWNRRHFEKKDIV